MDTLEDSLSSTRRDRWLAIAIVVALGLVTAYALPQASVRLSANPVYIVILLTLAWSADGLTAVFFLIQAQIRRSRALLLLACGYAYCSLLIIIHALTFPGAFAPAGLLGADTQSAIWFWVWWHGGFPLFIIGYGFVQSWAEGSRGRRWSDRDVLVYGCWVVGICGALAVVTLGGGRLLPALLVHGHVRPIFATGVGPLVMLVIVSAIAVLVRLTGLRRLTDLLLAIALCASLFDCALSLLVSERFTLGWYVSRTESVVGALIVLMTFLRANGMMLARLMTLSRIDGLTELVNRRAFDEDLAAGIAIAIRAGRPFSLLMIDVDFFKGFNDRYGHQAGDEALRAVAACIRKALVRRSDVAARYGGEEFAVILPITDGAGASKVAERVRSIVVAGCPAHAGSVFGAVTVSIGVSTFSGSVLERNDAAELLITAADVALYRAKADGRNRVVSAEFPVERPILDTVPPGGVSSALQDRSSRVR